MQNEKNSLGKAKYATQCFARCENASAIVFTLIFCIFILCTRHRIFGKTEAEIGDFAEDDLLTFLRSTILPEI